MKRSKQHIKLEESNENVANVSSTIEDIKVEEK